MAIDVRNLGYVYNADSPFRSDALKNISFTIEEGEFVGIIGHTGSGKSTLIQMFNGLLVPTSGTVTVNGISVEKGSKLKALRDQVGLVFQYPEYQLFEETVGKDVAFGPRNLGLSEEEILHRVHDSLLKVHMDPQIVAERSPFELSGGQKRRVAIAGVLAMNPRILVLDEPAAGLDPRSRNDMLDLLSELHQSGLTVIMVSHSMDDVARVAQRVLALDHGELVMDGSPREVYARSEELERIGLGIPTVAAFGALLREKGVPVPRDILTVEEMKDWLLNHRKGGVQ